MSFCDRIDRLAPAVCLFAIAGAAWADSNPTKYTLSIAAKQGDVIGGFTLQGVGIPQIDQFGRVYFAGDVAVGLAPVFTNNRVLLKPGDVIGGKTVRSVPS